MHETQDFIDRASITAQALHLLAQLRRVLSISLILQHLAHRFTQAVDGDFFGF